MKYCMYCGQQLIDKAAFCVKCGQPVILSPDNSQPSVAVSSPDNSQSSVATSNPQSPPDTSPFPGTTTVKQQEEVPQSPYSWSARSQGASQPKTSSSGLGGGYKYKSDASKGLTPEREEKKKVYDQLINQIAWRFRINGIIWAVIASIQLSIGLLLGLVGCALEISDFYFSTLSTIVIGIINLCSGIGDISYASEIRKSPRGVLDRVRPLGGAISALVFNVIFGGFIGVGGSIYYLVGVRAFVLEKQIAIEKEY